MEESPTIMKSLEAFERKAEAVLHKKSDVIELELLLMDAVAAAEKNGMKKGVLLMAMIM